MTKPNRRSKRKPVFEKTSWQIESGLLLAVKHHAIESGKRLYEILDEALREYLMRQSQSRAPTIRDPEVDQFFADLRANVQATIEKKLRDWRRGNPPLHS